MTNREVARAFAEGKPGESQRGTCRSTAEGGDGHYVLWSYSTPIAIRAADGAYAQFTAERFSVTTSTRHESPAFHECEQRLPGGAARVDPALFADNLKRLGVSA